MNLQKWDPAKGPIRSLVYRRYWLLRLLLLLLTDADLEVGLLGILERLMIVPGHCIAQILVHVGILRQDCHQREILVARGTERPETLNIWDCHNSYQCNAQALLSSTCTCLDAACLLSSCFPARPCSPNSRRRPVAGIASPKISSP